MTIEKLPSPIKGQKCYAKRDLGDVGRAFVISRGTVLIYVRERDGSERAVEMSADGARKVADALMHLAWKAEQQTAYITGATRWVAIAAEGDRVLVRHSNEERWFRRMRVGQRRIRGVHLNIDGTPADTRPRCRSCEARLSPGDAAFCEVEPAPYPATPWRDVRLCASCVVVAPRQLRAV